jgi:hypothetical protein
MFSQIVGFPIRQLRQNGSIPRIVQFMWAAYYGKAAQFSTNKKGNLTFQWEDGM